MQTRQAGATDFVGILHPPMKDRVGSTGDKINWQLRRQLRHDDVQYTGSWGEGISAVNDAVNTPLKRSCGTRSRKGA